jgi:hypothetical protein
MKNIGYIYVLANSSMPGAVKVGKTTRSPLERAQELSGVTGLPTPFIVVYEQLFEDCTAAENFVHTILGQKGFRVSENREFFNAPVSEIVRAITLAPGAIIPGEELPKENFNEPDDFFVDRIRDDLDDMSLDAESLRFSYPWQSVFDEAKANRYGYDDILQDESEALRLFILAAKLGSLQSYEMIGVMHENGNGTVQSKEKALKYYKEGARNGNFFCYWRMGYLFHISENYNNSEKSFSLFIKNRENEIADGQHLFLLNFDDMARDCISLLVRNKLLNAKMPESVNIIIDELKPKLILAAQSMIQTMFEINMPEVAKEYQLVLSNLDGCS